ncbi:2,3-dihydro-2,3-dihydroxybenzoate dehydrogenase [Vibrio vulnificus]|uniref:2,3-dihydro-2,3-dihydroxybenzoate dehydrogenase n=1 Tax=Vibrio vulnificus TaxID=672 RepID=UPI00307DA76B
MFNQFLEKQTVFLTGAAKGIGFSVMQHLLEAGARVVATDIDEVRLKADSDALMNRYREQLFCYHLDLSQPESVARRVAQMVEQHGPFDHLVCCAGVLHLGAIASMPLAQIEHTFNVNTFGTLAVMQVLAEGMKARRAGSMVIVGSNAANTPRPNMGAYGASKAALHMLVKSMGIELAEYGVRCNIVSPGSTRTDMQMQLWSEEYGEPQVIAGNLEQFRLGIPLRKMAEPQDIARSVLFLLSDLAGHITLHDLRVDGGATLDN